MSRLKLFYRLLVRPLFREPARLALIVLAVALGVAVVLAIELAGNAAAGSFHSSMETLAGDNDLEIVASGGVPESVVGALAIQPFSIRVSPRMEDSAVVTESKQTLPLIGLDLVTEGSRYISQSEAPDLTSGQANVENKALRFLEEPTSVWVGASLKKKPGDSLELLVNDQTILCTVRGVYADSDGNENAILMDLAGAQRALHRYGRVDRILLKVPESETPEEWISRLKPRVPEGVVIRPQGTGTEENRKMLAAFRWNLRLLSYIALVVGAFLIYNTISVSVVRRRAEIGIVRAIGASRSNVLLAFLGEAASLGLAGALVGLPIGRLMASGAVKLMALTVESLYVSSRPGPIGLTARSVVAALFLGIGLATASAIGPAREAMQVSPVDAMSRGRREYTARIHKGRDLIVAVFLGVLSFASAKVPPIAGKPLFGYQAAILLIISGAFAMPAFVEIISRGTSIVLSKFIGVEGVLASRSLASSLRRTSVLVAALSTAIAMMVSVGIMVGSFRQTVLTWMDSQLPADLYLRPAGDPAADRHPTISLELADQIAKLPGVQAVDRLRAYEISFDGMPATLAAVDLRVLSSYHQSDFFSGRPTAEVLAEIRDTNNIIVSEPFTYKHHLKTGDSIILALGESQATFKIADVHYDYSSERGYILMDRTTLLRYLPDQTPSNLAIFVSPTAKVSAVREKIQELSVGHHILIFSDRDLRTEAIRIFDRTFAITYALESVAILVAVMGIAGALMALVIDRRREFGLLRFLGASSKQIRKLVLIEAALLGLLANIAGFLLGYLLSLILIFVINKQSFGWTIRFHWPVAVLLGALSTVYLATLISGLYPAGVAVRLNPLEVIHEE